MNDFLKGALEGLKWFTCAAMIFASPVAGLAVYFQTGSFWMAVVATVLVLMLFGGLTRVSINRGWV